MNNQCVLISALRYLNVVYDLELLIDDDSAAKKLRSYVKLFHSDEVLADYWAMYKETYKQEKASSQPVSTKDDFSLWNNDDPNHMDNDSQLIEETSVEQNVMYGIDDMRISLPRDI